MLIRNFISRAAVCAILTWSARGQDVAKSIGADNLRRYTSCHFGDKVTVEETVENTRSFARLVDTTSGRKTVTVVHGFSLHIAYDATPFVNFKAERLGPQGYKDAKQTLVDNLRAAAANTAEMESSEPKKAELNGLEGLQCGSQATRRRRTGYLPSVS